MISLLDKSVEHEEDTIGGIALATIVTRKKINELEGFDEWLNTPRPLIGSLCKGCISCQGHNCYFAYRKYPECSLIK